MDTSTILHQDFKAFGLAIEQSRTDVATILANRFITNVLFAEDKRLATLGFVLREIAKDNLRAEHTGGTAQKAVLEAVRTVIGEYEGVLRAKPLNSILVWKTYHAYITSTRSLNLTEPEITSYKENTELTGIGLKYLFETFLLNPSELMEPGAIVPQGCVNELSRMISAHGITSRDLPLYGIAVATSWLYDYVARYWDGGGIAEAPFKKAQARFESLLSPVRPLLDNSKYPDLETIADSASDVLANILLEWRKDYIRFMEVGSARIKKTNIPISKQTKDKLSETIKGAIEKDILGKEPKK